MGARAVEEAAPAAELPAGSPPRPSARRRVRVAAAAAVALVALAVLATVLLSSRSPTRAASGTGVPPGQTTTTVARRTLTESATVDGTLGYAGSAELYDRLASAGTFTWLPAVGAVIARGGTLFRVNNLAVVLMYGSVPAYRALREGVASGPDVRELNENLIALGFDPYGAIGDLDRFGEGTSSAVRRWQKAEGLAQTGEVQLGRVIFASGAQRVTKLHVALGQDPPGKTPARETPAKETPAKKSPSKASPKSPSKEHETPAKESPSKESPSKESPSKESPGKESDGGGGGGAGTLVLSTTSTQQIVQLQVKANEQQLARVGERTPVTLPDGRTVHGHITEVGTVASESSENEGANGKGGGGGGGGGESATIPVTITLERRVARLDKAPVSVELVKSVRHNVLAVPATALTATAGGGYAIEALEGERRVELAVTPGMFANGYVEIEGDGVHEGLTVIESQ